MKHITGNSCCCIFLGQTKVIFLIESENDESWMNCYNRCRDEIPNYVMESDIQNGTVNDGSVLSEGSDHVRADWNHLAVQLPYQALPDVELGSRDSGTNYLCIKP